MPLPHRFNVDHSLNDPLKALSLGMGLMKLFKVNTWQELVDTAAGNPAWPMPVARLEAGDIGLLDDNRRYLQLLNLDESQGPVLVGVCQGCGTPQLTTTGVNISRQCLADPECAGESVRAKPATRMDAWLNGYTSVVEYRKAHGILPPDDDELNGGKWLQTQRKALARDVLDPEHKQTLDDYLPGWDAYS